MNRGIAPQQCRQIEGYGIQLFDTDPAQSAHPWRTLGCTAGEITLDDGVPNEAPAIPELLSAVHITGSNVVTFSWHDKHYAGTGNLGLYKNGTLLIGTLGPCINNYTDTTGVPGDVYQVQWTNTVFHSRMSLPRTAA